MPLSFLNNLWLAFFDQNDPLWENWINKRIFYSARISENKTALSKVTFRLLLFDSGVCLPLVGGDSEVDFVSLLEVSGVSSHVSGHKRQSILLLTWQKHKGFSFFEHHFLFSEKGLSFFLPPQCKMKYGEKYVWQNLRLFSSFPFPLIFFWNSI